MITRRSWLKRGATVLIGGMTVIVGEPVKAAPAPVDRDDYETIVVKGDATRIVPSGNDHYPRSRTDPIGRHSASFSRIGSGWEISLLDYATGRLVYFEATVSATYN